MLAILNRLCLDVVRSAIFMATKKQKFTNKKTKTSNILLRIIGCILVVAVISFGALAGLKVYKSSNQTTESDSANINTADVDNNSIKKAEPTNDETTTPGNDAKAKTEELEKQQSKEVEKNEKGLRVAKVVLNEPYRADNKIIISSTITNIVETEGNCAYIFTNGQTSITKKTNVLPNAKNTVCEAVVLEKSDLSAGKWKVRLEYKSKLSEGVSETQTFKVE